MKFALMSMSRFAGIIHYLIMVWLLVIPFGCLSNKQISPPRPIACPTIPKLEEIPAIPVSGKVYGRGFSLERARISYSTGAFILQQGKNSQSQYLAINIYYLDGYENFSGPPVFDETTKKFSFSVEVDRLENKIFAYGKNKEKPPEEIGLKLKLTELEQREVSAWDYNLLVQFGKRQQNLLPGKLYLCMGSLATEVKGTFEAEISDDTSLIISN